MSTIAIIMADKMFRVLISTVYAKVQQTFKWVKTHADVLNSTTVFKYNPEY